MTNFKNHTFKRMHIRTSMKSSLNYSLRPSVTLKSQTRQEFVEKDVTLKPNRLFGDGLEMVATSRNIDRREVLKHPLGPLPWASSNCDGTCENTINSTLAQHIECWVAPAETFPLPSAFIIAW